MARDRCLICDRYLFEGDQITRPTAIGVAVHRQCYVRDAGLETTSNGRRQPGEDEPEDD